MYHYIVPQRNVIHYRYEYEGYKGYKEYIFTLIPDIINLRILSLKFILAYCHDKQIKQETLESLLSVYRRNRNPIISSSSGDFRN